MSEAKLLAKGAEADVFEGTSAGMQVVLKIRNPKAYRVKQLDEAIRAGRTRKEARLLHAAKRGGALCPIVLRVGKYEIAMQRLPGKLMREMKSVAGITADVGRLLASIHSASITHGDFTPANIMIDRGRVAVIDFGLGEFATDDEERATDVLLMKKSLPAAAYTRFLSAYARARGKEAEATLERLKEIERRGRYVVRGALA